MSGLIGAAVPRVEDERLLRGHGRYVADLPIEGVLEAAVLRSPHARARVVSVDLAEARALPGVVAAIDGRWLAGRVPPMEFAIAGNLPDRVREAADVTVRTHGMPALADGVVNHVGQAVAIVVAADRYVAEDALELIAVEYEPLPVVADAGAALAADAPRLEESWPDNVAVALTMSKGDVDAAFADAPVVVTERLESHRYAAAPMETRGVAATVDPLDGSLTVWSSTQMPHQVSGFLAETLRMPPRAVRVIAPDVGGGFGPKGVTYPEDLLVPLLARELGRPIRWIEDRAEHLAATAQGREQVHQISLAADDDGRILAVRDDAVVDVGAYSLLGAVVPLTTATHLLGPYDIANARIAVRGVLTNKGITAPYRGAGRPEAVFAMERMVDRLAARLGLDPAEVRRRNLIRPAAMPYDTGFVYRDGADEVYDSGDYPRLLERAMELAGHDDVRRRQRAERTHAERTRAGRTHAGIGYAAYVEATGLGPFEAATVTIEPDGTVRVVTGTSTQGQSHRTTLAQIAADALDVPFERVEVITGDSRAIPAGFGTIASRSLVVGGNAVSEAALRVRDRALRIAADLLEADPRDLTVEDGTVRVKGDPGAGLDLAEVAASLTPYNPRRPAEQGAELAAESVWRPPAVTFAAAVHVALVEVDVETGVVRLPRYIVVHDAGRIVNPVVADGQITGGVAQGIGGALYEELGYDATGQLRTGSLMDYLLPTASEMPEFVLDHIETPSTLNPLGVKGLGEGGAIGPPAAIANAVEDALRPYGVVVRRGPLSPDRVRALLRKTATT